MDAIALLTARASVSALTEPAPGGADLDTILAAALRAPDHGRLRPWRFLAIAGAGRGAFGAALGRSLQRRKPGVEADLVAAEEKKALRAPLILVVAARVQAGKIPEVEQLLSAGVAAGNVLLAAQALGYGGVWKTGDAAYDPALHADLGLAPTDRIVGFLYLGTPQRPPAPAPELKPADFISVWPPAG